MDKAYYLGLDIGTDSVGYAVTDTEYNILKFHGEPAWGSHLFEEAKLGDERRSYRTARRRLDRRQQRVKLLQELFAEPISKVDPRFFIRMQESALFPEDKPEKHSLFNDIGYTDREYYETYPTIHHLLVDLMTPGKSFDVRLLYLACAWLVAHRGHFLREVDKSNIGSITDFNAVYEDLRAYLIDRECAVPWDGCDINLFGDAIRMQTTITKKFKELLKVCFKDGKAPKETEDFPFNCQALLKALCGSTIKAKELFGNEDYSEIPSFTLGSDDATLAEVMSALGDDAEFIECLKAIYDWGLLVDILAGSETVSHAKVKLYEQHARDLRLLKYMVRKYCPEKYNALFRSADKSAYTAYSYHGDTSDIKGKSSREDFCAYVRKILEGIEPLGEDAKAYDDMISRLKDCSFMPKQKVTDNRVIPYQLYWYELDIILKNAENYLSFLTEKDGDGLSVSDKIRSVFTFRVPYFVGPLNPNSNFAWIKRKVEGKIYPWNFEKTVDLDASEESFIDGMLNKCTYLPSETTLPKDSLLYHKFLVLNEINNLKINGVPITVEAKQKIYNDVFLRYRKVTPAKIRDCLLTEGIMSKNDTMAGIDITVKSDLKPWHDFKRLLDEGILTEKQVEEIITRATYVEDKIRFKLWLDKNYSFLSPDDIIYISRLKYKDFGRLSARLLNGVEGKDKATGKVYTIIGAMWNTNKNLMELLSDKYTFRDEIDELRNEYYAANPKRLDDRLDEMYISNSVKRSIIRTLDICDEVTKAFGKAPEKIFIEMTRGGNQDDKGKRAKSRREQILALYEKCDDEDVRLLRQQLEDMGVAADNKLQSDKLFLYYMQLGRCMYTGKAIDITLLGSGNYNIEHIYPQSLVKDDSIMNNEVLVDSIANGEKSDSYPIDSAIRSKMMSFWDKLHKCGLISDEKYKRLTRSTGFSADEKWGFINRQMTETTQSTKAVATLLNNRYPDTKIVYVKARLASEFRQTFKCLKSRQYNDLHHAKDAYLNIVCGNVYDMRFSHDWFNVNEKYSVKPEALYTHPVVCNSAVVWNGNEQLEKVKKYMQKNNAHLTRYAFCRKSGFFDQLPVKATEGLVPRKANLPTEKYGGYNKPAVSFFMLVSYKTGKKSELIFMPVELLHKNAVLAGEESAVEYAKRRIGGILGKTIDKVSFPIGRRQIKVNSVLSLDGYRMYISGSKGNRLIVITFMPFVGIKGTELYIKRLENFVEKAGKNPNYVYDAKHDIINANDNLALYDLYIDKLKNSIYKMRPNNPVKLLEGGRDKFIRLAVFEQAKLLLNIHPFFGRLSGGSDLTLIGGATGSGSSVISASVSNWAKLYKDVRIIDQSASGLWESRSVNLIDLL